MEKYLCYLAGTNKELNETFHNEEEKKSYAIASACEIGFGYLISGIAPLIGAFAVCDGLARIFRSAEKGKCPQSGLIGLVRETVAEKKDC